MLFRQQPSIVCLLCLALGCQTFRFDPPAPTNQDHAHDSSAARLPSQSQLRVSQFVFLSDLELKKDLPLFQELAALREQVLRELHLPASDALIQVYVFEDRETYEAYMKSKYPDLPNRRAFFVAQPRGLTGTEDLLVYTYWSDRVQEDLRHELTHALLHSVLKDVPLWLDEGLAEYYEVPPDCQGVNQKHVDNILSKGEFNPDLSRLETLGDVKQMDSAEYREAWAWVHLMLRGSSEGKKVLVAYLKDLRAKDKAGPISPRLEAVMPGMNEALVEHVRMLSRDR